MKKVTTMSMAQVGQKITLTQVSIGVMVGAMFITTGMLLLGLKKRSGMAFLL
jgi:hypothetical protein